jgi:hypothetical protein
MSQKKIDRAIEQLEEQIRAIQLAIATLKDLQRVKPAIVKKPKAVGGPV